MISSYKKFLIYQLDQPITRKLEKLIESVALCTIFYTIFSLYNYASFAMAKKVNHVFQGFGEETYILIPSTLMNFNATIKTKEFGVCAVQYMPNEFRQNPTTAEGTYEIFSNDQSVGIHIGINKTLRLRFYNDMLAELISAIGTTAVPGSGILDSLLHEKIKELFGELEYPTLIFYMSPNETYHVAFHGDLGIGAIRQVTMKFFTDIEYDIFPSSMYNVLPIMYVNEPNTQYTVEGRLSIPKDKSDSFVIQPKIKGKLFVEFDGSIINGSSNDLNFTIINKKTKQNIGLNCKINSYSKTCITINSVVPNEMYILNISLDGNSGIFGYDRTSSSYVVAMRIITVNKPYNPASGVSTFTSKIKGSTNIKSEYKRSKACINNIKITQGRRENTQGGGVIIDSKDLLAYYSFNGNLLDSSNSKCNAYGTDITYTRGISGEAVQFNGFSSIIKLPIKQKPENDFTIAFWINPYKLQNDPYGIMSDGEPGEGNNVDPWIWIIISGIKKGPPQAKGPGCICWNWEDINAGNHPMLCSQPLPTKRFSFVVLERKGNYKYIYINGSLVASQYDNSIPNYLNPHAFVLGDLSEENAPQDYHFLGAIDEFMLYKKALTIQEIQALYNRQETSCFSKKK